MKTILVLFCLICFSILSLTACSNKAKQSILTYSKNNNSVIITHSWKYIHMSKTDSTLVYVCEDNRYPGIIIY
jgi:hypothetical protein